MVAVRSGTEPTRQIVLQIRGRLQTHGDPQQSLADPGRGACLGRDTAVRRGRGMGDGALGVAQVCGDGDELRRIHDPTVDSRFGKIGKQRIKDTGPLTTQRMQTVDEEFLDRTKRFITQSAQAKQPFFAWFASSRMHIYTHLKPESRHLASDMSSEFDIYGSGLMEHDGHVGQLLKLLDDLTMTGALASSVQKSVL